MRLAIGIEYDGRAYAGWQFQRHAPSVQQALEGALAHVANGPVPVTCAGRTDAGVHAVGQVIHFDTDAVRPLRGWLLGVTSKLPDDISVTWVRQVSNDFSARFSATGRSYRYILLPRATRPGLLSGRVAWTCRDMDAGMMDEAAQALVGEHDFSAYRAIGCQALHPRREITRIRVYRHGPYIHLDISANAFLHHMVRNIAGVLMAIGAGEQPINWARQVLEGRDRTLGGVTAPAEGLYMVAVDYPEGFGLPAPPPAPAFA